MAQKYEARNAHRRLGAYLFSCPSNNFKFDFFHMFFVFFYNIMKIILVTTQCYLPPSEKEKNIIVADEPFKACKRHSTTSSFSNKSNITYHQQLHPTYYNINLITGRFQDVTEAVISQL